MHASASPHSASDQQERNQCVSPPTCGRGLEQATSTPIKTLTPCRRNTRIWTSLHSLQTDLSGLVRLHDRLHRVAGDGEVERDAHADMRLAAARAARTQR